MSRPVGGPPRPYPMQPLLDAAGITLGQLGRLVNAGGDRTARAALHGLTLAEADTWALRLHLMPEEVWPELFLRIEEGAA